MSLFYWKYQKKETTISFYVNSTSPIAKSSTRLRKNWNKNHKNYQAKMRFAKKRYS